jgi:SAM-dependent methyltransferase
MADVFERYISKTPFSYTLFRAAECRELMSLTLARPTLDLGCSVGEFVAYALRTADGGPGCDAGVDLSLKRLAVARDRAAYGILAAADAAALPLSDASFASVFAVSVCEHFSEPQRALREANRVLRPGGLFVATIVLADIHRYLFYPRIGERLAVSWFARWYRQLHDRIFKHESLQSKEEWERMLERAGFRIIVSRKIVSPRLTCWFDFWLITAWPYKIMQWLDMRPIVWRPKWLRLWLWRRVRPLIEEGGEEGSTLLVVAEKR